MSVYRQTTLGATLLDTLRDMVRNGDLKQQDAYRCVQIYDEVMSTSFPEEPHKSRTVNVQGHLQNYRNFEGEWTFILKDARITMPSVNRGEV
jgi:hypothetical protein